MKAKCDDCGKVFDEGELDEAKCLGERVEPGGPMPSGECPSCGALCYPCDAKSVSLRLVVDVKYVPNGESIGDLAERLRHVADNAAGEGMFTGDGPAEVEQWRAYVGDAADAEKFSIVRGGKRLHALAESKDMHSVIETADFAMAPDSRDEVDVFQAGIKVGLRMAALGVRNAVELACFDEGEGTAGMLFIGTPEQAKARLSVLPDAD